MQNPIQKLKVFRKATSKNTSATNAFSRFWNTAKSTTAKFRTFESSNHTVRTVEIIKLCLSAMDDKRYVLDDGLHTLAYGHKKLRQPL